MKIRKPDFMFVLAIIVGVGVIVTMKAQAGAAALAQQVASSAQAAIFHATAK